MTTHPFAPRRAFASLCLGSLLASAAHAQFISESFSGYSVGSLNGVAAQGTGLAGNWTTAILAGANVTTSTANIATITSSGLTFGSNYTTSGGALQVTINASNIGSTQAVSVGVNTAAALGTITGTVYTSYLFNVAYTPSNTGAFSQRATNTLNGAGNTAYFVNAGDISTTTALPGFDYNNGSPANATTAFSANTTYVLIGKFTNVGSTGGVGTQWILTQAQYDDWVTSGFTETLLNSRTVGTGSTGIFSKLTDNASATVSFTGGTTTLQFTQNAGVINTDLIYTVDELRYGASLDSITAIPEPSTCAALAGVFALGIAAFRRRRS